MARVKAGSFVIEDVRLVIFDKDGTLIDLYTYWSNMVALRVERAQARLGFDARHIKDIMFAMGVDTKRNKLRPDGPVGLKKREIVLQAMADALARIGHAGMSRQCDEFFKEADDISVDRFSAFIKPMASMYDLIDALRKAGCSIAIATTDRSERAALAMKFLGIMAKIDIVVGSEMVEHYKPAPDMVYMILETLRVPKENAVIVGDAITDVQMGLHAGLKAAIGVCSGLTPRSELVRETRYVIDSIADLKVL